MALQERSNSALVIVAVLLMLGALMLLWRGDEIAPSSVQQSAADDDVTTRVNVAPTGARAEEPDRDGERTEVTSPGGQPPVEAPPLGTVRVFVGRQNDLPVGDVVVRFDASHSAKTGRDGWLELDVPPGSYVVTVDAASLPDGMVPPALQAHRLPSFPVPDGYYGRIATVAADETVELRLRVFAASRIVGMVTDPAGNGLPDMFVRAQCRKPALVGYHADAKTRADGIFVLEGLRPNVYTIEVHTAKAAGAVPVRFEVLEGVSYSLEPLVVGGNGVVRGRVVDQDGKALADVPVVSYPCEEKKRRDEIGFNLASVLGKAVTDANGVFELAELPIGLLRVQVHPEGALIDEGEAGVCIVRPISPVTVDLRKQTSFDLGQFALRVRRPFKLRLDVKLDEDRIRAIATRPVRRVRSKVFVVPQSDLADQAKWRKLGGDKRGRYKFQCETPHETISVIVRVTGLPDKVLTFEPTPLGVVEETVSFP